MRFTVTVLGIFLVTLFAGCSRETNEQSQVPSASTTISQTTSQSSTQVVAPLTTDTTDTTQTTQTTQAMPTSGEMSTTQSSVTQTSAPAKKVPASTSSSKPAQTKTAQPPTKTETVTTQTSAPAAKPAATPSSPVTETKAPAAAPASAASTAAAHKTPAGLPKNHTVSKEGVMHGAGFETPMQRCAVCHGRDLKGGKTAPSCYSCHEKTWS